MAMERYVKALDIDSDCFAAANGVGMVFARRGKPEIVASTSYQNFLKIIRSKFEPQQKYGDKW